MLSKVDIDLLTQTDRGIPMGEYLRRYWHPVMLAEEVPEPDRPHRRASMFFGRNEECGLRCKSS
jgi:hypothetical protein